MNSQLSTTGWYNAKKFCKPLWYQMTRLDADPLRLKGG